jgi:hypothetical protein
VRLSKSSLDSTELKGSDYRDVEKWRLSCAILRRAVSAAVLVVAINSWLAVAQMPSDANVTEHGIKSTYFGFSYDYPDDFVSSSGELERRLQSGHRPIPSVLSALIVSASEPDTGAKPRRGVAVIANQLPLATPVRSGSDYLDALGPQLRKARWKMLRDRRREEIAGHEFWRLDYYQADVYQSVVCTILNGYAVNFLFTGRSGKDLDSLVESLHSIKFEQDRPGR